MGYWDELNNKRNLLQETLEELVLHSKTPDDVIWVGTQDGKRAVSWEEYRALALAINYDDGFGHAEIPENLVVVGTDWWLERGEYDGSEWWAFKTLPVRQQSAPLQLEYNGYHYLWKGEEDDDEI